MSAGLLAAEESIRVRIGADKEILQAPEIVYTPENQQEARMLIYEGDYLHEYLEEFSPMLMLGKPKFISITEPSRQTVYRYDTPDQQRILLTRAHRDLADALRELN